MSVSCLGRLHVCFLFLALCFHAELRKLLCYGRSSSTNAQSLLCLQVWVGLLVLSMAVLATLLAMTGSQDCNNEYRLSWFWPGQG